MKTKLTVTVELDYDGRFSSASKAIERLLDSHSGRDRIIAGLGVTFLEKAALDTSDEHLRAIAEQRNLAMWWFDEDYVQNNLLDAATPEAVTQIVKDLAGDAGVQERIAEEVVEYINNHKE